MSFGFTEKLCNRRGLISFENPCTNTFSTQDALIANEMPSPPARPTRDPGLGELPRRTPIPWSGGPPSTTSSYFCRWSPVTHPGGPSEGGSEHVSLWRWTWKEATPWPQRVGGGPVRGSAESSPPASFASSRRERGKRLWQTQWEKRAGRGFWVSLNARCCRLTACLSPDQTGHLYWKFHLCVWPSDPLVGSWILWAGRT